MNVVDRLYLELSFGGVEKIATPTYNPNGSFNRNIEPYLSTWIQRAVEKYDFVENEDYIRIITDSKSGKCDFIVSMDMAKELCLN
jgi:hypothetical protein